MVSALGDVGDGVLTVGWIYCVVLRNIYGNVVWFSEIFMEILCCFPENIWKCFVVLRNIYGNVCMFSENCYDRGREMCDSRVKVYRIRRVLL